MKISENLYLWKRCITSRFASTKSNMFLCLLDFWRPGLWILVVLVLLCGSGTRGLNGTSEQDAREVGYEISTGKAETPPIRREQDVVSSFLEQVEQYEKNKDNCTAGVGVNLGPGVVKHGIQRFKKQALVAVNRANLLTRIWMQYDKEPELLRSEYLFYSLVRNMVEGDPDIFAAGNCYDKYEFKDYHLFCPFSYRLRDGRIIVKDLSLEYQYLDSTSEFFFRAREKAYTIENKMKRGNFSYLKGKCHLFVQ